MKAKHLLAIAAFFSAASVMAQATIPTFTVDQEGSFVSEMGERGHVAYADWNNDGYMDFLMYRNGARPMLWKNNGDKTFTDVGGDQAYLLSASLFGAAAMWLDYDNDGYLDLFVTGWAIEKDPSSAMLYAFHNEGPEKNYLLEENFEFGKDLFYSYARDDEEHNATIMFPADFNNDGYTDILFCGGRTIGTESPRQVTLWVNDKNGSFYANENPEFYDMNSGGCYVADFNNDGMMDICTTGWDEQVGDANSTTVYLNTGDLTFEAIRGFGHGSVQGLVFPVDYNNDGVLDLIETGRNCNLDGWGGRAFLYVNDGTGKNWKMYDETDTWLEGRQSRLAFADINNDGYTDFATSGWAGDAGTSVGVYLNNGDLSFEDATEFLPDRTWCRMGDINFVDINNDGLMEIHLYGYRDGGDNSLESPVWPNYITYISGVEANQAPGAPLEFTVEQDEEDVLLCWEAPEDDTTPSDALRYNVYAKNLKTGSVFCLTPANIENGFIRVNRVQALLNSTSYTFKGMKLEDYEFGVQAVDNGARGGLFAKISDDSSVESVKETNVAVYALNGVINIVNGDEAAAQYAVFTANGAQVATGDVAGARQAEVTLAGGVYVVKVTGANGVVVAKVVL